jgi:hypothetical protein
MKKLLAPAAMGLGLFVKGWVSSAPAPEKKRSK